MRETADRRRLWLLGPLLALLLLAGGLVPALPPAVASPSPETSAAAGAGQGEAPPVRYTTVEDFLARAIARSLLGRPGGLTVAIWTELARTGENVRYATRYLGSRQTTYRCYPDFVRKFSRFSTNPLLRRNRALLLVGHAGFGLGFQDAVRSPRDIRLLNIPPQVEWDRDYAPLEFVAVSRIRVDMAEQYDLIVLGQCNPRKCLRFAETGIAVGPELHAQIKRLSDRPRQLTIVRNPQENLYLVGKKIVHREPYYPLPYQGPLPRVIAPDVVGEQSVSPDRSRSSQTDVFILAGEWTEKATERQAERIVRPTAEMVVEADRRVRAMLTEERREARLSRGQSVSGAGRPTADRP